MSISQESLTYTNQNRTAYRPGGASCYPAALYRVNRLRCRLSARLDEAPQFNNSMSFGLALEGFPNMGASSIGECHNSWGLYNNRSSPAELTKICSSGVVVDSFRALRVGDIVTMECDRVTGRATLFITGTSDEYQRVFIIPVESNTGFVIGATFCNDHKLTIISHNPAMPRPQSVQELSRCRSRLALSPPPGRRVVKDEFPARLQSLFKVYEWLKTIENDDIPPNIVSGVLIPYCENRAIQELVLEYPNMNTSVVSIPGALGYKIKVDNSSYLPSTAFLRLEGAYTADDRHSWAPDTAEFHFLDARRPLHDDDNTTEKVRSQGQPVPGDILVRGPGWRAEWNEDGGGGGLGDVVAIRRVTSDSASDELALSVRWRCFAYPADNLPWYR